MDRIDVVELISRWVHLTAAIVAIGGVAFARLAMLPAVREALDDERQQRLHAAIRARWSKVVMTCIALLLITGGWNFVTLAMPPKVEPVPYHPLFGIKFLAALAVFLIASALVGTSGGLERFRRDRRRWLSVILVLGVLIVFLSGILHQLRTKSGGEPAQPTAAVTR